MASGTSMSDGSDIADDFPCSACSKDNKYVESVKFCVDCKDYLCETCLDYHRRFSSMANHHVSVKSRVLVPIENVTEVDISHSSDRIPPSDVPGICIVRRGTDHHVIFTDWKNRTVKVLDLNSLQVTDAVKLKSKPYGVCELPHSGMIAVTVHDDDQLAIMGFQRSKLVYNRNIIGTQVPIYCRGCAVWKGIFNDTLLVVSGGGCVGNEGVAAFHVFASVQRMGLPEPIPLYPIDSADLCTASFSCFPRNVVPSIDCNKIFITDSKIGVIVIDTKGNKIGTITDPILKGARGICADENGNLYVGGMESANVVKFNPDGQLVGEILNRSHGLKCPISLCYDSSTRSLLIGSRETVTFRIVRL